MIFFFYLYENVLAAVGITGFKLKVWPYKANISKLQGFQTFHGKF